MIFLTLKRTAFLFLGVFGLLVASNARDNFDPVDENVINLEPFVIFAGEMDVIDGIT